MDELVAAAEPALAVRPRVGRDEESFEPVRRRDDGNGPEREAGNPEREHMASGDPSKPERRSDADEANHGRPQVGLRDEHSHEGQADANRQRSPHRSRGGRAAPLLLGDLRGHEHERELHELRGLLTGPSKANKTWGLIALAISVATGGFWVGMACSKRRVLYIDLETDRRTLQKRIAEVAAAKGSSVADVRENLSVWPLRGQSCGLRQIVNELFARCEPGQFGLVVIDPAYMIQDGDENNAKDIREFFAELDRLCVRLGCTVVISHHHSKGAQGLKSSIDRGSGSGVFGRAPDAVVDLTELVLEPGTLAAAREVRSLAATPALTGWRMSFTLREFAPKPPMDVWFAWPLHVEDETGLLEGCKPNYGGLSEARRQRVEQDRADKMAKFDETCDALIGGGGYCLREDVMRAFNVSESTANRYADKSSRFRRVGSPGTGKARIVRRDADDED